MIFLWPLLLLLLLLVPLFIGIYILILQRKRKFAVRYSSLSLIREAMPKHSRWRQHLTFALFMLTLISLIFAVARPVAEVEVPLSRTSIILALDVSRSMCSTDMQPNRMSVAQDAALAFVEDQADKTRIGLVAFAGFAEIVVPPTNNKEELTSAIENFTTALGTAIGNATLKSIDAIAEVNSAVSPSGVDLSSSSVENPLKSNLYQPDIIVLLTDGANSRGIDPLVAAQQAADRQVRVYTIGFGTVEPGQMVCSREQLGSDAYNDGWGGWGGSGWGGGGWGSWGNSGTGGYPRYLLLDENTLQGMADLTGGEYYRAENAKQLYDVFVDLPAEIVLQKERTELSVVFSIMGAALASIAVALSMRWHRVP